MQAKCSAVCPFLFTDCNEYPCSCSARNCARERARQIETEREREREIELEILCAQDRLHLGNTTKGKFRQDSHAKLKTGQRNMTNMELKVNGIGKG